MSGKEEVERRGKRPKVDLDSLNLSIKPLREARELIKKHPSLITPFQLKVLSLYRKKKVADIVKEDGISKESVYAVLRGLREKRRKARLYLSFMRKLSRVRELQSVLSPKTTLEEDETLEDVEEEQRPF
jgi:predicted DNA-binding protein YlxM (UPF0122 family)